MSTKHEKILQFIESLPLGHKISVRQIAREMKVSEGTAYRAIKEAENRGFVSTIERVGTVRIEKKHKANIEKLTFAEVVNIVDGRVLGGRNGLYKTLNKFVIGAMKLEDMMKYVDPGNLLIVGNRVQAHKLTLKQGAAILITGGFDTSNEVKELADELELPVISTSYDTFTVASLINRAIYDRLIKKEIMMVDDIILGQKEVMFLTDSQTVSDYHSLVEKTKHSRFPVVDQQMKLVGIVTSKDILDKDKNLSIDKVMTKNPISVTAKTSIASAAHMMVWEGIELLPVIDTYRKLIGVISRQDVLKALQYIQKQPQIGETIDDIIMKPFEEHKAEDGTIIFKGEVTPQMTNQLGSLSTGPLISLVTESAHRILRQYKKGDLVPENLMIYFVKPVQIESELEIRPKIIEVSRKFGKVDVEIYHKNQLVSKALISSQVIER
ncbi:DRTGG domain-containing protein [Tepidibacillus fermentans]|uniref:Putative transcriptional regulator n=1 Tax=Tepidibacillus fermentans TaxID=1281767 RepID=A0A4V2UT04_9BACI|nr:DRTGG domain-containing protein [Tepidibacillus fermentans]TCS83591.1 putative transcriptional regulator [Tepidibacillus fermentans]